MGRQKVVGIMRRLGPKTVVVCASAAALEAVVMAQSRTSSGVAMANIQRTCALNIPTFGAANPTEVIH